MRPILLAVLAIHCALPAAGSTESLVPEDLVFEEKNGIVTFEAEHFSKQENIEKRAWYLTTVETAPDILPDGDPPSTTDASGSAYLEILPDTRRTHEDKLIRGENFTENPGEIAVLTYNVHFNTPGTYHIWARTYSTTTEDNGLHFGINGTWPDTARRWQTVTKDQWHWRSAQRTEEKHSGVPGILTFDVPSPGLHTIQVSMREDGIALDKILLAKAGNYTPRGMGPAPAVKSGEIPQSSGANFSLHLPSAEFDISQSTFTLQKDGSLAIDPSKHGDAIVSTASPFASGRYDITLLASGENTGSATHILSVNAAEIGRHTVPSSRKPMDTGKPYEATFRNIHVDSGDVIEISSTVASPTGEQFPRARWSGLVFTPVDQPSTDSSSTTRSPSTGDTTPGLRHPRLPDSDGSVIISGELRQWHKVTLTLDGPFAHELDTFPNPFTDLSFWVTFSHESGSPTYTVPGYFAADGNAAETSAESGTKWRAHFSPDTAGKWTYTTSFRTGREAAFTSATGSPVSPFHGKSGTFKIDHTDKELPDFRARGRLAYVGKHHLQFLGDKSFFLKAGADSPETLLAYSDFDNTHARKNNVPLKSWAPHSGDFKPGDPTWKDARGKNLIGALNYLSEKGMNAVSFLTYNVSGDGDNIWPFTAPGEKIHYDCSKLDQWGIILDHATTKGLFLHFKLQENEIDDNRLGQQSKETPVPASLDGGKLGPERKLYCREIIARFGHALALNWNIGEENTQTTEEIRDMADFIRQTDPYPHPVVLHTFPNQQEKQYRPLLGEETLQGTSLQNSWNLVHRLTAGWLRASRESGVPWVVPNDEQNGAATGTPPDPEFRDKNKIVPNYTIHDVRKHVLWGNLMAGGAGVEYYFGYKLAENDLLAENWRSRNRSWTYARIALDIFREHEIPFQEMSCRDDLIGNPGHDNSKYCLARENGPYLVYLPTGGSTTIELPSGDFTSTWVNPRTGEANKPTILDTDRLTAPDDQDWLVIIR